MKRSRTFWFLLSLLAGACSTNPALVVGGPGGSGGTSGPDASVEVAPRHPLPISGQDALNRMAMLMWQAPLDGSLLALAMSGQLQNVEDLIAPAHQILADARAAKGVSAFFDSWLRLARLDTLTKDAGLFPAFTPAVAAAMRSEIEAFGVAVTLTMNGTYKTLMTAPIGFPNQDLAPIYGLSDLTGGNPQQISLNEQQRAGVLALPGMQAMMSSSTRNSPVRRGDFIQTQFLCRGVALPPAGVPALTIMSGMSLRQALTAAYASPLCATCHNLSWGLAFEGFDAIGRARTTDNGQPVDVSMLALTGAATDATVNGPVELAKFVADDAKAQGCMASQWLAYALGKDTATLDAATVASVQASFQTAGLNLKDLIVAVMTTDAFLAP